MAKSHSASVRVCTRANVPPDLGDGVLRSEGESDELPLPPLERAEGAGLLIDCWWWCDTYTGTKEQLIAAGIVKDGQFPGDPGNGKYTCSYTADGQPVRRTGRRGKTHLQISRASRGRFAVRVHVSQEEQIARKAVSFVSVPEREALKKDADKAMADFDRLPKTAEEFKGRAARHFLWCVDMFFRNYMQRFPQEHGFRFAREVIEDMEDAAREIYWNLLDGDTIFDRQTRQEAQGKALIKQAKADQEFQSHVAAWTAGATRSGSGPSWRGL